MIGIKTNNGLFYSWYAGQPKKHLNDLDVKSLFADGDELGLIISKFKNIPIFTMDYNTSDSTPRGYPMKWFGDHANFIWHNL